MSFIEWKEEYNIDIDEIDQQHKELADLINQLVDSFVDGDMTAESGKLLQQIITKVKIHFETEEKLMKTINYAEINRHKSIHNAIAKQLTATLLKIKKGKKLNLEETMDIYRNALIGHFVKEDSKYGKIAKMRLKMAKQMEL